MIYRLTHTLSLKSFRSGSLWKYVNCVSQTIVDIKRLNRKHAAWAYIIENKISVLFLNHRCIQISYEREWFCFIETQFEIELPINMKSIVIWIRYVHKCHERFTLHICGESYSYVPKEGRDNTLTCVATVLRKKVCLWVAHYKSNSRS